MKAIGKRTRRRKDAGPTVEDFHKVIAESARAAYQAIAAARPGSHRAWLDFMTGLGLYGLLRNRDEPLCEAPLELQLETEADDYRTKVLAAYAAIEQTVRGTQPRREDPCASTDLKSP